MWSSTEKPAQGGGFMQSPGQFGSPSAGSTEKRQDRIQSVVPVAVATVLATPQDQPLRVSGAEVHMAVLVGRLETIDRGGTKVSYTLADETGTLTALRWIDAEAGPEPDSDLAEGMLVRMVVRVRPGPSKGGAGSTNIMCFHLEAVTPEEELIHRLEVQHAALTIAHVAALSAGGGAANGGGGGTGLTNSMVGGGGGADVPMVTGGGIVGLSPQQQMVYSAIHAAVGDQGVHRDQVYGSLTGKVPRPEIDRIMEFLSNEGHIYNTTDDDHFKATDC
ncbi:replication protein A 32 kDa subunit-like [Amphibalanus amphitrite]|uniref:replication protein A 32 kDa subunit-like n=1 Tax=Amphibalanus amphitrite TaxID=1232801 RepID=UPI001C90052E|nr:replication protein A 32 kDa subunit-like [Amphibalanus amphitrite]XP_043213777.1 replication protein A 32 kDa subunit-like [Amphibalanus amphitrite]